MGQELFENVCSKNYFCREGHLSWMVLALKSGDSILIISRINFKRVIS